MFAQVAAVETSADKLAGLLTFCQERLPEFRDMPGFAGFYLLADRDSGKILTISLFDTEQQLRQHNARGAQVREEADAEVGIASPPVDIYEVLLRHDPSPE